MTHHLCPPSPQGWRPAEVWGEQRAQGSRLCPQVASAETRCGLGTLELADMIWDTATGPPCARSLILPDLSGCRGSVPEVSEKGWGGKQLKSEKMPSTNSLVSRDHPFQFYDRFKSLRTLPSWVPFSRWPGAFLRSLYGIRPGLWVGVGPWQGSRARGSAFQLGESTHPSACVD